MTEGYPVFDETFCFRKAMFGRLSGHEIAKSPLIHSDRRSIPNRGEVAEGMVVSHP